MNVFPFLNALVNVGAAIGYARSRQWWLALVWLCYAVAGGALGMVGRK